MVRILYIDDEPRNLELVARELPLHSSKASGPVIEIDTASGVDDGVRKASIAVSTGKPYDVVITDYNMPDETDGKRNGIELAERLRRMPAYVSAPIIVHSSHNSLEAISKDLRLDISGLKLRFSGKEPMVKLIDNLYLEVLNALELSCGQDPRTSKGRKDGFSL